MKDNFTDTPAQFAKRIKRSRPLVQNFIKEGKISSNSYFQDPKSKRILIDPIRAIQDIEKNVSKTNGGLRIAGQVGGTNQIPELNHEIDQYSVIENEVPSDCSPNEAKRRSEILKAEKIRTELLVTKGELVSKKKEYAEAFKMGRKIRDELMGVGKKIAGSSVGKGYDEILAIVNTEIKHALSSLSELENA